MNINKNLFSKITFYLEWIIAFIFLFQAFGTINIIPTKIALELLGQGSDTKGLIFSVFFVFFLFMIAGFTANWLNFAGIINKDKYSNVLVKFLPPALEAFIAFMLTILIGGVFSALKIFPNTIGVEYLNFYLFWFLIFDSVLKRATITIHKNQQI